MPSPSRGSRAAREAIARFDRSAAAYDAWFTEPPGSLIFPGELAALRLLLSGQPRPWVEVGAGSGRFTAALGVDLGLEPSLPMLKLAAIRGVTIVRAAAPALPFQNRSIGCLLLISTLCFIDDPAALLREAGRVLTRAGALIIAEIPAGSPWGKEYIRKGGGRHQVYRHAHFRRTLELEKLLTDDGFRVAGRSCSALQPPGRVLQPERGWWGLATEASFIVLLATRAG